MNYEKQTYLNTERLTEMQRTERAVSASVPSDSLVGGIRFYQERAHTVRLEVYFPNCAVRYTPYFDGVAAMTVGAPYFTTEVFAERGEHVFDVSTAASHGGAILRVSGIGVREGRRYYERVGGYYTATENVIYMRRGERNAEEIVCASGEITRTSLSVKHIDACLYYDKSNESYTATTISVKESGNGIAMNFGGQTVSVSLTGLTSLAIADGAGLPNGHDCIVAYTNGSGVLSFLTAERNGGVSLSSTTIKGVKRVRSAARGSVLLVEDSDDHWQAYLFSASGDKSLTFGGTRICYSVLPVVKSGVFTPYAAVTESLELYYKDPRGVLVRRDSEGTTSVIGYADAYYMGGSNGALSQDNEIVLYDGE